MSPAPSELLNGYSQISLNLLVQLRHLAWLPQAPLQGAMKAAWGKDSPLRDRRVSFPQECDPTGRG